MLALSNLDSNVVVVLFEQDLQLGLDVFFRQLEQPVVFGESKQTSPLREQGLHWTDRRCVRHETIIHVENSQDMLVHNLAGGRSTGATLRGRGLRNKILANQKEKYLTLLTDAS